MKKAHFIPQYFYDPLHPISINVIGVGGNGSQVLTALARIHTALTALGHKGLHVVAFDDDIVTEANLARQLFSPHELGVNKAVSLIHRINTFFGLDWEAIPHRFNASVNVYWQKANITITCVDNARSRFSIAKIIKMQRKSERAPYEQPYYWMDFGNSQSSGQVILGTLNIIKQPASKKFETVDRLPVVTDCFPNMKDDKSQGPSCSLAEALEKQDLFTNSALVQLGMSLLWKIFREGYITQRGLYMNLNTLKINPINI